MSKRKNIIKWSIGIVLLLIIGVVSFGFWFMSLLPEPKLTTAELETTRAEDLEYLNEGKITNRGKILAVVTSVDRMGTSEKSTGYELTELARAYYVFEANGFEVDIASPQGGLPPVVIDKGDMKEFDYAFLNDSEAQEKVTNTIMVSQVDPSEYSAIFFVGGKGAMFDFPKDKSIKELVGNFYDNNKVIGAVCHGPAALLNVKLDDGSNLLEGKKVSCFTSEEELFLIPDARKVFPFLLDEEFTVQGAHVDKGEMYLQQVSIDGNLITGQNPWSTWSAAESVIESLGYPVKKRQVSPEEQSVVILKSYEEDGYANALETLNTICEINPYAIDRELLAVHSLVSAMQLDFIKSGQLIRLLQMSNQYL